MPDLRVSGQTLAFNGKTYRCAIGKSGIIAADKKREGDGATPEGTWRVRECWYRPDRVSAPETGLKLRPITKQDGWCDDPKHPRYNRHVTLPFEGHHEQLWLEDGVYDIIVPLGYNDDPPVPDLGSAIFLHVARPDYAPTEGCVALAKKDLLGILPMLAPEHSLTIATD